MEPMYSYDDTSSLRAVSRSRSATSFSLTHHSMSRSYNEKDTSPVIQKKKINTSSIWASSMPYQSCVITRGVSTASTNSTKYSTETHSRRMSLRMNEA